MIIRHNVKLYERLKLEYQNSDIEPSQYWKNYVHSICNEIEKNGLEYYGKKYILNSGGFGDTPKITPRPLIRKIFKIPFIYKFLEKKYVYYQLKKIRKNFFNHLKNDDFSKVELLEFISNKIDKKTRNSNIIRTVEVNSNLIPHSYAKGSICLDIIEKIIEFQNLDLGINDLFKNNVVDIGGGVGSIIHSFYEYKLMKSYHPSSKFILLEQFPVSYIAKQSLEYFCDDNIEMIDLNTNNSSSKILVCQNTSLKDINNLNVSLYFNSSSFQEMDKKQIEEYCDFMEKNKAHNCYLACFLYPSNKSNNSDKEVLKILNKKFKLIGWDKNYFDKYQGGIQGNLYLYTLTS